MQAKRHVFLGKETTVGAAVETGRRMVEVEGSKVEEVWRRGVRESWRGAVEMDREMKMVSICWIMDARVRALESL